MGHSSSGDSAGSQSKPVEDLRNATLDPNAESDPPPPPPRVGPPPSVPIPLPAPEDSQGEDADPPKEREAISEEGKENSGRQRPSAPKKSKVPSGPKAPRQIGGRRKARSPTKAEGDKTQSSRPAKPRIQLPVELVCRQSLESGLWEIVLKADDESRIREVKQSGETIILANGDWPLKSFEGQLSIELADGSSTLVQLFDQIPLIFKFHKNWQGEGRRIGQLTQGFFIVFAPKPWNRRGHIPVESENCSDPAFAAHYFARTDIDPTQGSSGFQEARIPMSGPKFHLCGKRVFDDSMQGDLFVGTPPQLTGAGRVVWLRVGEEGVARGWGCNFKPSERTLPEVMESRQGHFFLRAYDDDEEMLDSTQFRHFRNLQQILVNGEPYSNQALIRPGPTGHSPTTVEFISSGSAPLRAKVRPGSEAVGVEGNRLIAGPSLDSDNVCCELECDGGRVNVELKLPRVWWRIEQDNDGCHGEWRSTPLNWTRCEFRSRGKKNTKLGLRVPDRIKSVEVGFDKEPGLKIAKSGAGFELPIRHFIDHRQIDEHLFNDAALNVRIDNQSRNDDQNPLTLIRVLSDPPPEIVSFAAEPEIASIGDAVRLSWATRNTSDFRVEIFPDIGIVGPIGSREVRIRRTTEFILRICGPASEQIASRVTARAEYQRYLQARDRSIAEVRGGGGWRSGKGFSLGELRAAKLRFIDTTQRSIKVDERRRSVHSANVEILRRQVTNE